jgi:multidrug efflux pump
VIYLYMERFSDWLRERRERRALRHAQRGAI